MENNVVPFASTAQGLATLPDPEAMLAFQTKAADALMRVITDGPGTKFVTKIGDKDFLGYEAWQVLAHFNGCHTELEGGIEDVRSDDGALVAYGAVARVVENATGVVRSRAYMECGLTSFPTQGKEGREKHKAAQSAAQTWAASKACRMAFSFVAVLAGFEAVTAEEVADAGTSSDGEDQVICPVHHVAFFQKGKMRSPAHQLDGGGWCNFNPNLYGDELKDLTQTLGWERQQVNDLCKEVAGKTWSQLGMNDVQMVLGTMRGLAEAQAAAEGELDQAAMEAEASQPALG